MANFGTTSRPDHNQIIAAFESGMSIEEIASDIGWATLTVKSVLTNYMQTARAMINRPSFANSESELVPIDKDGKPVIHAPLALSKPKPLFDENDLQMAKHVVVELAQHSEVDGVRLRAAERIIDEHKGRKDLPSMIGNGDFNLTVVNNLITKGMDAAAASRQRLKDRQMIDVSISTEVAPTPAPQT